jgi:hypothetical protein
MKFSDAARLPRKGPWPFSGQSGFFKRPLRLLLESKLGKEYPRQDLPIFFIPDGLELKIVILLFFKDVV